MRIIQIMPEFGLAGAETMCEYLSLELTKMGHDVTIVSLYNYHSIITERLSANGINIIYLEKRSGLDFSMIFKIRNLLIKLKPDVIHTHRYVMQYVIPATFGIKVKRVHTVHNIAKKENQYIARKLNKLFYKLFNVVPVALTESIRDSIHREYDLSKEIIPVVFNGIPIDHCIVKQNYKFNNFINIVHIGRFSEQKNHKEIISAICQLHDKYSNLKLSLIGEGPLKQDIIKLVKSNKATNFIFLLGTTDNPYLILHSADIFILPSLYEGMPMTLIEAMGTALPIVASNVGGIPDIIIDHKNGILCNSHSDSIYQSVDILLKSESLRNKIGKAAFNQAQRFSTKIMAEEYLKIYSK